MRYGAKNDIPEEARAMVASASGPCGVCLMNVLLKGLLTYSCASSVKQYWQ